MTKISSLNAKIGFEEDSFDIYLYANNLTNNINITKFSRPMLELLHQEKLESTLVSKF